MAACVLKPEQVKPLMPKPPNSKRQPLWPDAEDSTSDDPQHFNTDIADYFANDPDDEIRRLGRLALQRTDVNDLFALGDLAARRAVGRKNELLILYVVKAMTAYRYAYKMADNNIDRDLARKMMQLVTEWAVAVAQENPSPRNIATALWAAAEDTSGAQSGNDGLNTLFDQYYQQISPQGGEIVTSFDAGQADQTYAEAGLSDFLSQTDVTNFDRGLEETILSDDSEHHSPAETEFDKSGMDHFTPIDQHGEEKPHPTAVYRSRRHGPTAEDEFKQGDTIESRYEVADVRRGGMGVVYLCYDHDQREPVAIKTFQSRFLNNERAVNRFNNEAVTWIKLDKHRHVVQARLVQNIMGRPHIILEHISSEEGYGPDLRSWIDHKRLDLRRSLEFGLHISLGMQHATQKVPGLVHRDLKPANILVTHDGIAKVTDFGLVRSLELEDIPLADDEPNTEPEPPTARNAAPLTRVGAIVGTAPYMSPEQCQSKNVDVRSDIYAFGCLLFEMLTGHYLFDARKFPEWLKAHVELTPAFTPEEEEKIPESLRQLVLWCLQKKAKDRPKAWSALVEELSSIYEEVTGEVAVLEVTGPALEARELMDKGYSLTELSRLQEALQAYDSAISLQTDYAWAWARKGRTLRLLGRYEEALECYNQALEIQPRYAFAWTGKGLVLDRIGRLEQALACHETAAEISPKDVWHWWNQADVLHMMGQYAEAIKRLQTALEIDPLHPNSWAKMGQIYRYLGQHDESIKAYEEALRLAPEYGWAHNGLGLTLKFIGRLEDALVSFKRATYYQPDVVWHWYTMAETLIELRRYQEAVYPARQATITDPNHALSWSKLGQALRYVRRYEEAIDAYDHALDLQPQHSWTINGKGMALESLKRYDEALKCYQEAAKHADAETWPTLLYNQGNVLVLLKKYRDALPLLERATQLNPDHARSWARLGSALRNLNRLEDALKAYQKATQIDPHYAWAWNEQGLTYEAMGQHQEALKAYEHASRIVPNDWLYLYEQADMLVYMQDYQQALSLLDSGLKIDENNPRIWGKHGQILRRLNRMEEALKSYQRAIELDEKYAWAWCGQGLTLHALSQHEEALRCFRKAAEYDPHDVWYWYNQGDELIILGQIEAAQEPLKMAIRQDPEHIESWVKLGQVLRVLDQQEDALNAFDKALVFDPDYDLAWDGRGLVLQALDRREEALASFQRASQAAPEIPLYYTRQVDLLLEMQRREEALQVIDAAIEAQPLNSNSWARRGQILRRMTQHEKAIDSYQRALELDDSYAWAWNGQGLSFAALERWEEALSCYELAVFHSEGEVWFWHNYGEALLNLEDYEKAVEAFQKALEIDPDHEPSQQKLEIAQRKMKEKEE